MTNPSHWTERELRSFKQQQKRTLIVLGAGASIGASLFPIENSYRKMQAKMPSGENFFYDLFTPNPKKKGIDDRGFNLLGVLYGGLNELIVKSWELNPERQGWDPDEWKNINIEDVFTFLDVGSRMYPKGREYQKGFSKLKDYLEDFIALTLDIKAEGLHCEHLFEIVCRLKPSDSIISFNWDTIADHTIEVARSPIFRNYKKLMSEPLPDPELFRNKGVLLKLHGSLNWILCPDRKCAAHGHPVLGQTRGKLDGFMRRAECRKCGNRRPKHLIVPPTSNKLIKPGTFLHRQWEIALNKIPSVKKIVFIGYSFPSTDFYSQWLFRQIHLLPEPRPEIIVADPAAMKSRSEVRMRYSKLFKGCEIKFFPNLEALAEDASTVLPD